MLLTIDMLTHGRDVLHSASEMKRVCVGVPEPKVVKFEKREMDHFIQ